MPNGIASPRRQCATNPERINHEIDSHRHRPRRRTRRGGSSRVRSRQAAAGSLASHQPQDGSTLYLFKDGKMARDNKFGYPWLFKAGEVLETTDGRKMTPVGNEVAQLGGLLNDGHRNRWTRPSAGLPHLV